MRVEAEFACEFAAAPTHRDFAFPAVRGDEADGAIAGVGNIETGRVAGRIDRHAGGLIKQCVTAGAVVAAADAGRTRHGCHHAAQGNPADGGVVGIHNIDLAVVRRDAGGMIETGGGAGSVGVARNTRHPGQGAHRAIRSDSANGRVQGVCDVENAGGAHGDASR